MPAEEQPDFVVDGQGNVRDYRTTERAGQEKGSSDTEEKQGSSSSIVGWTAGSGVGFFVLLILMKVFTAVNGAREREPERGGHNNSPAQRQQGMGTIDRLAFEISPIETKIDVLEKTLQERFQRNSANVGEPVASVKQDLKRRLGPSLPEEKARHYRSLLQRVHALEKRLENMRITATLTPRQRLALDAASRFGATTAPDPVRHLAAAGVFVSVRNQVPADVPGE